MRAPRKKAIVLKMALARAGLHICPLLYVQGSLLVLKLLTEPRNRKIMAPNAPMNTTRYLYWVNRNEVAPESNEQIIHINMKDIKLIPCRVPVLDS